MSGLPIKTPMDEEDKNYQNRIDSYYTLNSNKILCHPSKNKRFGVKSHIRNSTPQKIGLVWIFYKDYSKLPNHSRALDFLI